MQKTNFRRKHRRGPYGGGGKAFHGSGVTVVQGRYCERCLKNGHQCPAREGSDECIFCEDNAPCPVMQRAATEHTRIATREPMLIGEARPTRGRYGEKLKKQPVLAHHPSASLGAASSTERTEKKKAPEIMVTVHAENPQKFLKHGGEELIRAAAKEIAVKEKVKCRHPECSKLIRTTKSGCCGKHCYWAKLNPVGAEQNGKRRAGGRR